MAILELGTGWGYGIDMNDLDISNYNYLFPISTSTTLIRTDERLLGNPSYIVEFRGENFQFDGNGDWIGGTLSGIDEYLNGVVVSKTQELWIPVPQFVSWIEGGHTETALNVMFQSNDQINGNVFDDRINGYSGNDHIHPGLGNDTIDGGTGTDIVNYTQQRGNFSLQATGNGWTLNGPEGLDTLTNVERLQFTDKKLALDLGATQNGGQAVKFIGALAYPLAKDAGTFGLILDFFDQGHTLSSISDLAVSSGLTASLAGSGSNADLAKLVFRNIVGGEADAAMTDMLVGFMDGRQASYTQGQFLAAVADLELNQEHVGLVGLQLTGLEYL